MSDVFITNNKINKELSNVMSSCRWALRVTLLVTIILCFPGYFNRVPFGDIVIICWVAALALSLKVTTVHYLLLRLFNKQKKTAKSEAELDLSLFY